MLRALPPDAPVTAVVVGQVRAADRQELGVPTLYLGALHDDDQLARVYAAADVTVMPSTEEAFGKVAMESLACGTPVVCYDTGGPRDIVDDDINGYRAMVGDVHALTRGILACVHPDRAARLQRAARHKVMHTYTSERQVSAYLDVYRAALGEASSGRRRASQR